MCISVTLVLHVCQMLTMYKSTSLKRFSAGVILCGCDDLILHKFLHTFSVKMKRFPQVKEIAKMSRSHLNLSQTNYESNSNL